MMNTLAIAAAIALFLPAPGRHPRRVTRGIPLVDMKALSLPLLCILLDGASMAAAQDQVDNIPTPDEEFNKPIPPPVCYAGKAWAECGSSCTKTCETPSPICTSECVPKCQCPSEKAYWNGLQCLSGGECPSLNGRGFGTGVPSCSGGKVYNTCAKQCTSTCANPDPICTKDCAEKCECPASAPYWDESLQMCISESECPVVTPTDAPSQAPTSSPTLACGGGQVFNDCSSVCTATCADPVPFCTKQCVRKCSCPSTSPLWDGVSQCIQSTSCPEKPVLKGNVNLYYASNSPISSYTFFEDVDNPSKTALRYALLEAIGQKITIGQHPNVTIVISNAAEATTQQKNNVKASFDASGPQRDAQNTLSAINVEFEIELVRCDQASNLELVAMQNLLFASTKNGKFLDALKTGGLQCPAVALQQNTIKTCHHGAKAVVPVTTAPTSDPTQSPTSAPTKKTTPTVAEMKLQLFGIDVSGDWAAKFSEKQPAFKSGIITSAGAISKFHQLGVSIKSVTSITAADRLAANDLGPKYRYNNPAVGTANYDAAANAVVVSFEVSIDACSDVTKQQLSHAVGTIKLALTLGLLSNNWKQGGLEVSAVALQSASEASCVGPPTTAPTASPTVTPAELVGVLQLYSMSKAEFNGWSESSSKHQAFAAGVRTVLELPSTSSIVVSVSSVSVATALQKQTAIAIVDESGGDAKATLSALAVGFRIQFFDCSDATNQLVQSLPSKLHGKLTALMAAWASNSISIPALAEQNAMAVLCNKPTAMPTPSPTLSPTHAPTKFTDPTVWDTTPAPTPGLVHVHDHIPGKSHFEAGKDLNPGVSVKLHLFGLPTAHLFANPQNRKLFEDAVHAALCPAGPSFSDCQWRDDLGERVVVNSYRENATLASSEKMYDAAGIIAIQDQGELRFFEHQLQSNGQVYALTASSDNHASTAVEVNFRVEFNPSCANDTESFMKKLPNLLTTMVRTGSLLTYLFALEVSAIGYPGQPYISRDCDPAIDLQLPTDRIAMAYPQAHCIWTGHHVHVIHRHSGDHDRSFFCRHYVDDGGEHACSCKHWQTANHPTPAPTVFSVNALFSSLTPAPTVPTAFPTTSPTPFPTRFPTAAPTFAPTSIPTKAPTAAPTNAPTKPRIITKFGADDDDADTDADATTTATSPPTMAVDATSSNGFTAAAVEVDATPETNDGCTYGRVMKECGGCTLSCSDPAPDCTNACVKKCECPSTTPIWHNSQCITYSTCPEESKAEHTITTGSSSAAAQDVANTECIMSGWSLFGDCSKTCGGGHQESIRNVIINSTIGKACGETKRTMECALDACPAAVVSEEGSAAAVLPTFTPTAGPTAVPTVAPTPAPTPAPVPIKYKNFMQLEDLGSNIQAMTTDTSFVFLATKTQLVKVRKSDMSQVGKLDLWPVYKQPTAIGVDSNFIFVTVSGTSSAQILLKLSKNSLQIISHMTLPADANVPYSMTIDEHYVYTGHYAMPGQILKISKQTMSVISSVLFDLGEDDVRQLEMDGQYLYANCNTKPGIIVKVNKDAMVKVKTAQLPVGANNPLAGCVGVASQYNGQMPSLFVGTSSNPSVIVKLERSNLGITMSRQLTVGYVSAMACDSAHIYAATYTEDSKLMKIRQSDLEQVQQIALGRGPGTGMVAALSAGQHDLFAGTDTENGRVYQVEGIQGESFASQQQHLAEAVADTENLDE